MGNPEKPKTLIRKEKIERTGPDENYVREKLNRLGIPADKKDINAFQGLTPEEADVAVKFLNEIKGRFRKEARGEKPRDYIESFWKILRDYNITLTLGDINSFDNFPIKNLPIKNENAKKIEENKKKLEELKGNIEKLLKRGMTSIDKLVEKLSEIYGEDEDWKKYLVQKNIRKREILELYLKSYVKEPQKFFLRHYTIGKRIEETALYRELRAIEKEKEKEEREKPTKLSTAEKEEKPTKLSTTDKVSYEITKVLKKKDLGE